MAAELAVVPGELIVAGRSRTFSLLPPPDASGPVPLVLVLHGNHPDAGGAQMREYTTFDRQASAWGLAVAYPDGVGGCWADGRGVTTADEAGVDDVAFLRAIIDWSAEQYATFADRAVVAGISNGAFMAHRMGVDASDQVAVLAAVAGGLPERLTEAPPAHAVSALLIHGTADSMSPIGGGFSRHLGPDGELRGRTLSLEESAAFWRGVDRCADPEAVRSIGQSTRTTARGGTGGTEVAAWTVLGGGHTWPGATPREGLTDVITQEFDAAEEICRFAQPLLAPADARRL